MGLCRNGLHRRRDFLPTDVGPALPYAVFLVLPFGDVLSWSIPVATAVLIVLGVVLLAGRIPFDRLAGVRVPVVPNPLAQA